jgi:hypothetical protein
MKIDQISQWPTAYIIVTILTLIILGPIWTILLIRVWSWGITYLINTTIDVLIRLSNAGL